MEWITKICRLCNKPFALIDKGDREIYPENCARCRCTKLGHKTAVKWPPEQLAA